MITLLQCGHQTEMDSANYAWHCLCPHCKAYVRVQAVEARKWAVVCWAKKGCRTIYYYTHAVALDHLEKHAKGRDHHCTGDFVTPPRDKTALREFYGRKVKFFIQSSEMPASYPERRMPSGPVDIEGECPF